jgi:hypothetical protein
MRLVGAIAAWPGLIIGSSKGSNYGFARTNISCAAVRDAQKLNRCEIKERFLLSASELKGKLEIWFSSHVSEAVNILPGRSCQAIFDAGRQRRKKIHRRPRCWARSSCSIELKSAPAQSTQITNFLPGEYILEDCHRVRGAQWVTTSYISFATSAG